MSNLKQLGTAWRMYAEEYRGAAVPLRVGGPNWSVAQREPYFYNGILYGAPSTVPGKSVEEAAWWVNFLAKYLSKSTKGGAGDTDLATSAKARDQVWWCPAWQGVYETRSDISKMSDLQHHYSGYSLNYMPTYTSDWPRLNNQPPIKDQIFVVLRPDGTIDANKSGTWMKAGKYTHPAERALIADSWYQALEAKYRSNPAVIANTAYQHALATDGDNNGISNSAPGNGMGQTTFDWYRHGKYPKVVTPGNEGYFDKTGGKVSYNVLYADGHVANCSTIGDSYKSIRMRFPD
jgi:prepilin-type processing-associated H-X9-DG protein